MPWEPIPVLFWEDFEKGDTFVNPWGRTVTDADIKNFAGIGMEYAHIIMDDLYVQEHSDYGSRIAHGPFTASLALSLHVYFQVFRNATGFLDWHEKFLLPVHIGDTLRGEMTVVDTRPTEKPDRGVVFFRNSLKNQRGEEVLQSEYTVMIRRKGCRA